MSGYKPKYINSVFKIRKYIENKFLEPSTPLFFMLILDMQNSKNKFI